MKKNKKMKKLVIILGILLIVLIGFGTAVNYQHTETYNIYVVSLVTQQDIHSSGDKDNYSVSTTYRYLVNTDKGTYMISPDGLYHSNYFGNLKKGKSYIIRTRGYSVPLIGMYPYIIEAHENNN